MVLQSPCPTGSPHQAFGLWQLSKDLFEGQSMTLCVYRTVNGSMQSLSASGAKMHLQSALPSSAIWPSAVTGKNESLLTCDVTKMQWHTKCLPPDISATHMVSAGKSPHQEQEMHCRWPQHFQHMNKNSQGFVIQANSTQSANSAIAYLFHQGKGDPVLTQSWPQRFFLPGHVPWLLMYRLYTLIVCKTKHPVTSSPKNRISNARKWREAPCVVMFLRLLILDTYARTLPKLHSL